MTDGAFKIWFDEEAEITQAAIDTLMARQSPEATRAQMQGQIIHLAGASDFDHAGAMSAIRQSIAAAVGIPRDKLCRPLILPDVDRLRIEAERAGIDYVMSEDVPRAFTIRNVEPLDLDGLKLPRNRAERRRMAKTGSRG